MAAKAVLESLILNDEADRWAKAGGEERPIEVRPPLRRRDKISGYRLRFLVQDTLIMTTRNIRFLIKEAVL